MSQVLAPELSEIQVDIDPHLDAASAFLPNSRTAPLLILIPAGLATLSLLAGGVGGLTDLAMLALAIICVGFVVRALWVFPQRFGIGAFIIYGGTLVWYCHDYFTNWFGVDFRNADYTPDIVAKHTLLVCIFTLTTGLGLTFSMGRKIVGWIQRIPESPVPNVYLVVAILMCIAGLMPYIFFNRDPFYVAIVKDMFAMRTDGGSNWLITRSGNLNYNYGAYWFRLFDLGNISGIIGAMYAIWLARSVATRVIGWAIFALWAMLAFGTGARSAMLQIVMPVIGLLYIRYQAEAATLFRRYSARAYIYTAIVGVGALGMVQYQGAFRNTDAQDRAWNEVHLGAAQGNNMYTEGLQGVELIPAQHPFFRNDIPGEGAVLVLYDTAVSWAIFPIPRAFWPDKPLDPGWAWYNHMHSGGSETEGATFTPGVAAWNYMLYGFGGTDQLWFTFWMADLFGGAWFSVEYWPSGKDGFYAGVGGSFIWFIPKPYTAWLFYYFHWNGRIYTFHIGTAKVIVRKGWE